MLPTNNQSAFSLIELSIVLVILGLLTGGILAGKSLIRASELRSISTDYNRYVTAVRSFQDKYFAIPGDMPNATAFWGSLGGTGSDTVCQALSATGTATCNGDGDGSLLTTIGATVYVPYAGTGFEDTRAWQHLANAGLLEGQYSGVESIPPVPGANVPLSKIGSNYFVLYNGRNYSTANSSTYYPGAARYFAGDDGKTIIIYTRLGASPTVSGSYPLSPEELWNIDTKIDDGIPASGKITAFKGATATPCTDKAQTAVGADVGAVYNLSDSNKDCFIYFVRVF